MISARDVLIALSVMHQGDWNEIYNSIMSHTDVPLEEVEQIKNNLKCHVVTVLDDEYPSLLKQVEKPPFVLFYYGDISLISNYLDNISVVGSREFSTYGSECTKKIIKEIDNSFHIVSGLARGIDAIAHQSAIDCGKKTIAVLASGIDYCYPKENLNLYEKIKKSHLLISEYPGDMQPSQENFPFRNRIVAGLSRAVLVSEAKPMSGSLITARFALSLNRDVMCVPYPIGEGSACNRLILSGAILVESGNDVMEQLSDY